MDHDVSDLLLVLSAPFIGSFLGLLAHRLPRSEGFVFGRSKCDRCGKTLSWRDLVPIVSWIWARGRCRQCDARIGAIYPIVELSALVVAVWSILVATAYSHWVLAGVGWILILLAVIDLKERLLPDSLTLPLIVSGLVAAWFTNPQSLLDHAIGAAVGYLLFVVVAMGYQHLRHREGLGRGDAKLFAAAGAWVSWYGLPTVLLVASVCGLVYALGLATRGQRSIGTYPVPFGVFLSLGFWLVLLYAPLRLY